MGGVGEMYQKSLDYPYYMLQSEFGSFILSKVKVGRGISIGHTLNINSFLNKKNKIMYVIFNNSIRFLANKTTTETIFEFV